MCITKIVHLILSAGFFTTQGCPSAAATFIAHRTSVILKNPPRRKQHVQCPNVFLRQWVGWTYTSVSKYVPETKPPLRSPNTWTRLFLSPTIN